MRNNNQLIILLVKPFLSSFSYKVNAKRLRTDLFVVILSFFFFVAIMTKFVVS